MDELGFKSVRSSDLGLSKQLGRFTPTLLAQPKRTQLLLQFFPLKEKRKFFFFSFMQTIVESLLWKGADIAKCNNEILMIDRL